MLNIPESVKELLRLDGTQKNIRITFPDGSREDICSDSIILNTVKFTESLCSQNQFKLGVVEASQFECDVMGIENIQGKNINVYLEILCDSTISGAQYRSDLGRYVYSIVYGYFTVSTCTKQADMRRRKIVAISSGYTVYTNPTEMFKERIRVASNTPYRTDFLRRLLVSIGNFDGFPNTKEVIPLGTYDSQDIGFYQTNDQYQALINVSYGQRGFNGVGYSGASMKCPVVQVDMLNNKRPIADSIYSFLAQYNLENTDESIYDALCCQLKATMVGGSSNMALTGDRNESRWTSYMYPWISEYSDSSTYSMKFLYPMSYQVTVWDKSTTPWSVIDSKTGDFNVSDYTYTIITINDEFNTCDLCYKVPRGKVKYYGSSPSEVYYAYAVQAPNERITPEYIQSFFELRAEFGKFSRDGILTKMTPDSLSNLYPSNDLYPSNSVYPQGSDGYAVPTLYSSAWYSDTLSQRYGRITMEYVDTEGNEASVYYDCVPYYNNQKYLEYVIDNNEIAKNGSLSELDAQALVGRIGEKIKNIQYMPCEVNMLGQPWLEAGDTLVIETVDGQMIKTIILSRKLSGEQYLVDVVSSK